MSKVMRRGRLLIGALVGLAAAVPAVAAELKLERVTVLMRHGIRPPTKLQPIAVEYSPRAWPAWKVGPGLLTEHGAKGVALLGTADRAEFARRGLLAATGCPAPGQLAVMASKVPRAISTAEAWAASFAPGCTITVDHPAKGEPDSLFHPLEARPSWFDGREALEEALSSDHPATEAKRLAPEIRQLETILGCNPPQCDLENRASTLAERRHDRPSLGGPLNAAATASESFLLEYVENKPLSEVGWGLVDRAGIERLLVFTAAKFRFQDRPLYIARAAAGPLANAMVDALTNADSARVALFAGHDTNIADLAGLLDLHWQVPGYPPDTVPPGSALGFELLSSEDGQRFVRAFYRSQDMEQLRNLQALGAASPAHLSYLDIPGCGPAAEPRSCSLAAFTALVRERLR